MLSFRVFLPGWGRGRSDRILTGLREGKNQSKIVFGFDAY